MKLVNAFKRLRSVRNIRKIPLLLLVALFYAIFFSVLFLKTRHGLGQFWDWAFPYYKDQVVNYFANSSLSWSHVNLGTPLAYSSDYYFRLIISLSTLVQPEITLYLTLVIIFSIGAYGIYMITNKRTNSIIAILLGIAAFVNPAIFYKLTAGHIDYCISYSIFIWLIYFMLNKYENNLRNTIILSLLLAFVGVQIQFFVFAVTFTGLYFFFYKEKIPWKFLPLIVVIPLLINLPWLTNYIIGANNLASAVGQASKVAFKSSSSAIYGDVLSFKFSQATLISQYFKSWTLLSYTLLLIAVLAGLTVQKVKNKTDTIFLIFLTFTVFCAAGSFELIALGPLKLLGSLFREVGHFAPLVILFMILAISSVTKKPVFMGIVCLIIISGIVQSSIIYENRLPLLNFQTMRMTMQPFKDFTDSHDTHSFRVLTYPFFDPLAIKSAAATNDSFPLTNSGYDNFTLFSKANYVNNAVNTNDFAASPQYLLLKNNYNLNILKPYHIKYIFDFSHIFRSTYGHYVPPTVYSKNIENQNNDSHFAERLLAMNPGHLKHIAPNVYEILDATPIAQSTAGVTEIEGNIPDAKASLFLSASGNKSVNFTDSSRIPGLSSLSNLFTEQATNLPESSYSQIAHTTLKGENRLFQNVGLKRIKYSSDNKKFSINADIGNNLLLNNKLLPVNLLKASSKTFSASFAEFSKPFIVLNGSYIIPIKQFGSGDLGTNDVLKSAEVYNSGPNQVLNGSFENGLWQEAVDDCNAYDSNAKLLMNSSYEHTDGKTSLALSATNHIACTHTSFKVQAGITSLFSLDYKTKNGKVGGYYLKFNDSKKTVIEQQGFATKPDWQTYSRAVYVPSDATKATLYLYAYSSPLKEVQPINYDNVSFSTAKFVGSIEIPKFTDTYTSSFEMPQGINDISVTTDENYNNIVGNSNFDGGLWQPKVTDCYNYDAQPKISQSVVLEQGSHGSSLELSATKHIACTNTPLNINQPGNYTIDFDYRSINSKLAGYNIIFNDGSSTTIGEQLFISDTSWHTYHKEFSLPDGATSAKIWLYAYESTGHNDNSVRYDNIFVRRKTGLQGSEYIYQNSKLELASPGTAYTRNESSTLHTIQIKKATKPFVYQYGESFSNGWKLYMQPLSSPRDCERVSTPYLQELKAKVTCGYKDVSLRKYLPEGSQSSPVFASGHIKLDGFSNGWLIDPVYIKTHFNSDYWHLNSDGSTDFNLVLYFQPQTSQYYGLVIAVSTILGSIGYLVRGRPLRGLHNTTSTTYRIHGRKPTRHHMWKSKH